MNYIKDIKLEIDKDTFNGIIEIPKGTNKKYELNDPKFDKVECVRKVVGKYPFYYGCFPHTYAGDKDPLDMILLSNKKRKILDVVEVLPFAVIKTIDNNEVDDKIICIAKDESIKDLRPLVKKMLTFLHTYKGKNANTIIDDKTYDAIEAIRLIHEAEKAYKQKHSTKNILNIF
jgi:inorganic pyrophosphatase